MYSIARKAGCNGFVGQKIRGYCDMFVLQILQPHERPMNNSPLNAIFFVKFRGAPRERTLLKDDTAYSVLLTDNIYTCSLSFSIEASLVRSLERRNSLALILIQRSPHHPPVT